MTTIRTTEVRAARPGEPEWFRRMLGQIMLGTVAEDDTRCFADACALAFEHEAWRHWKRPDGSTFESWGDFVAHPLGLNSDLATLGRVISEHGSRVARLALASMGPLGPVGRPRNDSKNAKGSGRTLTDSPIVLPGESTEYTVARLRRDAPDLADEVISGTKSAAAARREAGFASKSVRVSLHENTWTAAKSVVSKLGRERARELAERILAVAEESVA